MNSHPARKIREQRGLTIEEVAAMADVSERSIRRMESYEQVSAATREAVAAALGVDLTEIYEPVGIGSVISGVDGAARIAGMFNGRYVLQPLEFAPPIEVTEAELKARYAVDVLAPNTQRERDGWRSLAEASRANALNLARAESAAASAQAEVNAAEARGWGLLVETHEEATERADV